MTAPVAAYLVRPRPDLPDGVTAKGPAHVDGSLKRLVTRLMRHETTYHVDGDGNYIVLSTFGYARPGLESVLRTSGWEVHGELTQEQWRARQVSLSSCHGPLEKASPVQLEGFAFATPSTSVTNNSGIGDPGAGQTL